MIFCRIIYLFIFPFKTRTVNDDFWKIFVTEFQIKIMLAQVGYIKSNTLDEVQLQDVIMDIVTAAIRSTDVTFDLYRWSEFPEFVKSQTPITTTPLDSYTERMVCYTRIFNGLHNPWRNSLRNSRGYDVMRYFWNNFFSIGWTVFGEKTFLCR